MAGVTMKVTLEDSEAVRALTRMVSRGRDMTPLMRDIGEHLLNTTRERFATQTAPDGTPWAPLSATTKRRKTRNVEKVLTESGALRGHGLVYQASRDRVEVGSPLIYAGTHQFGAERGSFGSMSNGAPIPWGDIPARPFLGVSDDDEATIVRLIGDHLSGE